MTIRFASLALGALVFVGALTYARPADACSCMRPPDARAARDASSAVFEGKVVAREDVEGDQMPGLVKFTFEVTRRWKGDAAPGETVVITTNDNSAACGRTYDDGGTYLVYASTYEGELQDHLCSRTMPAQHAEEQGDFEALGPDLEHGGTPVPPAEPEPPRVEPPADPKPEPGEAPPPTDANGAAKSKGCAVTAHPSENPVPAGLLAIGLGLGFALRRRS